MNKQEFIENLRARLSALPEDELEDRLNFYREMIDDRVEDGLSEEEAVSEIGTVEEISKRIISEQGSAIIHSKAAEIKEDAEGEKEKTASKVLFWLGAPLWAVLGIIALPIVLVLFVSLWAAVASLWAVFGALAAAAPGCVVMAVINLFTGGQSTAVMLALGLVSAGVAIFGFYGCLAATRGSAFLTKSSIQYLKKFHR